MDNVENLVLNANTTGLVAGAVAGADALDKLAVNVGLTDKELDKAQSTIERTAYTLRSLAAEAGAAQRAQATATIGLRDYGATAARATTQLEGLQAQQARLNDRALAGTAPVLAETSLTGNRRPNGTFAPAGVAGLTDTQLSAIIAAENAKTATVIDNARKEIAARASERIANAELLASERALAAQQETTLLRSLRTPGVVARGPVATGGLGLSASELEAMNAAYARTTTSVATNTAKLVENAGAQKAVGQNLITARYALYSVASTYGTVTAAIGLFDTLSFKASADFQAAFVNIARSVEPGTTNLKKLYNGLVDLSTQIPVSFTELAKIGTLGAQLNITGNSLLTFTKNIAEFSKVTGITVEAAATGIGRIGQLLKVPESQYANLGSAILYVGNKSVATEAQVLTMSQGIAAAGRSAGLTAPQVVALGGTLASIGIQTYAARGAVQTLFGLLNRAVGEGGSSLEAFANIAGESAGTFAKQYGENAQGALTKFLGGINQLTTSGANVTSVLDSVGIKNINIVRTINSLSQNMPLYNKLLQESSDQYKKGTYLQDSYAKVNATLASSFTKLGNTIVDIFAAIGGGPNGKLLAGLVTGLEGAAKASLDFVSTPVGATLSSIGGVLLTIVGLYTGYRTIVALSTAATYGLITAQRAQATNGFSTGIRGTIQALTELRTGTIATAAATDTQTASTIGATEAMAAEDVAAISSSGILLRYTGTSVAAAVGQRALGVGATAATGALTALRGVVSFLGSPLGIAAIGAGALYAISALGTMSNAAYHNKIVFNDSSQAAAAYEKQLRLFDQNNTTAPRGVFGNAKDSRGSALQLTTGANRGVGDFFTGLGLGGLNQQFQSADASVKKIDASMAKLVSSGNAKEAAIEFTRWNLAAKDLNIPLSVLKEQFPGYEKALAKYGDTAGSAGTKTDVLAGRFGKAALNAAVLKDNTLSLSSALKTYGSTAQASEQATQNWYAALDAANQSIKDNGKNISDTTAKGRANNQSLYGYADATNKVAAAQIAAKVPLAQVQATLATGRANFISIAEAMGYNATQATNLANTLVKIGTFKYNYNSNGIKIATDDINAYIKALSKIPTSVTTSFQLQGTTVRARAGGGTVGAGETTLVGENGPEIAHFPAGTQIYPNGVTPHYAPVASSSSSSSKNSSAVLELGPRTIRALSQSATPVYLDGKLLTDTVNGHNQKRGRRGY